MDIAKFVQMYQDSAASDDPTGGLADISNLSVVENFVEYHLYIDFDKVNEDELDEETRAVLRESNSNNNSRRTNNNSSKTTKMPTTEDERFKKEVLLDALRRKYLNHVEKWTRDYIWQHDDFELQLDFNDEYEDSDPAKIRKQFRRRSEKEKIKSAHLSGRTRFGDNIEDEWFIVFLLRDLTRQFKELTVSLFDNDGQFLLIEAALALPRWLKPETSKNRVFFHGGELHIVPIPRSPGEIYFIPAGDLTVETGLALVRGTNVETRASDAIQAEINKRLTGYPEKAMMESTHRVKCFIPTDIALILERNPQMVAHAIRAFYERDLISQKYCQTMKKFTPTLVTTTTATTATENDKDKPTTTTTMAFYRVRFTRCLYAQLIQQRFHPPKPFQGIVPPPTNKNYKAYELGMKLTCAFEMLYQNEARKASYKKRAMQQQAHSSTDELIKTHNFDADTKWQSYLNSLTKLGYFKGEIKGSQLYRQLENEAKRKYLSTQVVSTTTTTPNQNTQPDEAEDRTTAQQQQRRRRQQQQQQQQDTVNYAIVMDDILSSASNSNDLIVDGRVVMSQDPTQLPPDDDDKWMEISLEELERMVNERQVKKNKKKKKASSKSNSSNVDEDEEDNDDEDEEEEGRDGPSGGPSGEEFDIGAIVKGMKSFVERVSSFEGAELPKGQQQQQQQRQRQGQQDGGGGGGGISFDTDKFIKIMKSALGEEDNDNDDNDDSSSEEGDEFYEDLGSEDEEEEDEEEEPFVLREGESAAEAAERMNLKAYMRAMDRELGETNVGQDFEKEEDAAKLATTASATTTTKTTNKKTTSGGGGGGPVNINFNLVKNLLASYSAQEGMPGPVSNLFGEMGIVLPTDKDQNEEDDNNDGGDDDDDEESDEDDDVFRGL